MTDYIEQAFNELREMNNFYSPRKIATPQDREAISTNPFEISTAQKCTPFNEKENLHSTPNHHHHVPIDYELQIQKLNFAKQATQQLLEGKVKECDHLQQQIEILKRSNNLMIIDEMDKVKQQYQQLLYEHSQVVNNKDQQINKLKVMISVKDEQISNLQKQSRFGMLSEDQIQNLFQEYSQNVQNLGSPFKVNFTTMKESTIIEQYRFDLQEEIRKQNEKIDFMERELQNSTNTNVQLQQQLQDLSLENSQLNDNLQDALSIPINLSSQQILANRLNQENKILKQRITEIGINLQKEIQDRSAIVKEQENIKKKLNYIQKEQEYQVEENQQIIQRYKDQAMHLSERVRVFENDFVKIDNLLYGILIQKNGNKKSSTDLNKNQINSIDKRISILEGLVADHQEKLKLDIQIYQLSLEKELEEQRWAQKFQKLKDDIQIWKQKNDIIGCNSTSTESSNIYRSTQTNSISSMIAPKLDFPHLNISFTDDLFFQQIPNINNNQINDSLQLQFQEALKQQLQQITSYLMNVQEIQINELEGELKQQKQKYQEDMRNNYKGQIEQIFQEKDKIKQQYEEKLNLFNSTHNQMTEQLKSYQEERDQMQQQIVQLRILLLNDINQSQNITDKDQFNQVLVSLNNQISRMKLQQAQLLNQIKKFEENKQLQILKLQNDYQYQFQHCIEKQFIAMYKQTNKSQQN